MIKSFSMAQMVSHTANAETPEIWFWSLIPEQRTVWNDITDILENL